MRVAMINTCDYGSTGKIMLQTAKMTRKQGHEVKTFSRKWTGKPRQNAEHFYFGSFVENAMHHVLGTLTGFEECFSLFGTRRLIACLEVFKPDIIHLHNLHGWYIHLPALFHYIKENNVPTIWTLHDCWPFTGHCPHFNMSGCDKWLNGCFRCPQYSEYPKSLLDNSNIMYRLKKKWFTGVPNLIVVTPSYWLADLVQQSFLKQYSIMTVNNGIDLSLFHPIHSSFREIYRCNDKYVVLGVSFGWNNKKGLDVFCSLAKELDRQKYQVILVGTDETVDKQLPESIISIHRTQNQEELAQIYSAADVFVNPTREDNYPTVNMEAVACGTPVVTFGTGGSAEMLDATCGISVPTGDIGSLKEEVIRICEQKLFAVESCVKKAQEYNNDERLRQYIKLYEVLNGD